MYSMGNGKYQVDTGEFMEAYEKLLQNSDNIVSYLSQSNSKETGVIGLDDNLNVKVRLKSLGARRIDGPGSLTISVVVIPSLTNGISYSVDIIDGAPMLNEIEECQDVMAAIVILGNNIQIIQGGKFQQPTTRIRINTGSMSNSESIRGMSWDTDIKGNTNPTNPQKEETESPRLKKFF